MEKEQTMQQMMQQLLANQEKAEANAKARQEEIARMQENTQATREEIKSGHAEMRSIICAFRSELKEIIQCEMKAAIQYVWSELDETTTCREETETEPNPGIMKFTEEHQENPKGKAAVMAVGGPRKRCRVRNLAAERRQKRKERTRRYRGSRRKLAAACRKVSRPAKVARRK
jgi:hypothetical protein